MARQAGQANRDVLPADDFGQGKQFYSLLNDAAIAAHDSTKALHEMLKAPDRTPSLDAFKLARSVRCATG